ncbi:hypothetical protein ACLOJK_011422 [Asimina triloba]
MKNIERERERERDLLARYRKKLVRNRSVEIEEFESNEKRDSRFAILVLMHEREREARGENYRNDHFRHVVAERRAREGAHVVETNGVLAVYGR